MFVCVVSVDEYNRIDCVGSYKNPERFLIFTSLGESSSLLILHMLALSVLLIHYHSDAPLVTQVCGIIVSLLVLHLPRLVLLHVRSVINKRHLRIHFSLRTCFTSFIHLGCKRHETIEVGGDTNFKLLLPLNVVIVDVIYCWWRYRYENLTVWYLRYYHSPHDAYIHISYDAKKKTKCFNLNHHLIIRIQNCLHSRRDLRKQATVRERERERSIKIAFVAFASKMKSESRKVLRFVNCKFSFHYINNMKRRNYDVR